MTENGEKEKDEAREAHQALGSGADLVEVATDSRLEDVFSFRLPIPGETYAVDGGASSNEGSTCRDTRSIDWLIAGTF